MTMTGPKQTSLFPDDRKRDPEYCLPLRDLDRSEVEPLAFKILEAVEMFCEKAEVAGSIRRRRGMVNDIDIVVLPRSPTSADDRTTDQMWMEAIEALRYEFDVVTEKEGGKLFIGYVPFVSCKGQGHVQVDLYRATTSTWGIQLLVRTGSKEHNVMLCNLALTKGMRLLYSQGLVNKDSQVIASKTETEVFEALGLPYIIPQDREIKEREAK